MVILAAEYKKQVLVDVEDNSSTPAFSLLSNPQTLYMKNISYNKLLYRYNGGNKDVRKNNHKKE